MQNKTFRKKKPGKNLHDVEATKKFLDLIPKAQLIKGKNG